MATQKRGHGQSSQRRKLRIETLEPRRLLAADPIITEFMASNKDALHDGYGTSPDWIEIYNNGDNSVNLVNYSLTDDSDEIDKWQFPQKVLGPGEYLIIFASGFDTLDPGGNLHTNFGLSSKGDYLALANPQGTILSEFAPGGADYPEQAPNISYGIAFDSTFTEVVSSDSVVKYLIPADGSVDATWTSGAFDDSGWQAGFASLGYEEPEDPEEPEDVYSDLIQTTLPTDTQSVYVRIPFTVSSADEVVGTLRMKYDDGFVAYLNGVQIAQANSPETVAYDSFATSFHVQEAAVEDVVFNVSDYSDLLQVGQNILSIHLMNAEESPTNDLLISPSLSIASGSVSVPEVIGGLISSTPGLPNTQLLASDVVFSHAGGAFADGEPFQLSITADAGDSIRYTLNGSEPQANSPLYTGPILISTTVLVRARTYSADGRPGNVGSAAFSRSIWSEADSQSTLPIILLENFEAGKPDRVFQDAYLSLYEVDESTGFSSLLDEPTLTTPIGQHRRGSSTFGVAKFSLRIELRDDNGNDKDVSLLDMPSNSDWILYAAGIFDRSLIRNAVAYDLSNQADNPAVRTRYVEVFNNIDGRGIGSPEYMGLYVLMETIKIDEDRVDIGSRDPSSTDPAVSAGGFIFKQDRADAKEDSSWVTDRNQPVGRPSLVHASPERANLSPEQVEYFRDYIQDFEDALYSPDVTDPDLGYAAYIDSDSWIEHHLMRVFVKDGDAQFLSEHFTISSDSKIEAGPVWDFNLSSGYDGGAAPVNWGSSTFNNQWWWGKLFNDPNFTQLWVDKWSSLRFGPLSDANLIATIDAHVEQVRIPQVRNYERWTQGLPHDDRFYGDPELSGWEAEIAHLKGWLLARANWIDDQITPAVGFSQSDGFLQPGTEVELIIDDPGAEVYYTVDGTDPRDPGGEAAPTAMLYTEAITINNETTVKVRAFNAIRDNVDLGPWGPMTTAFYSTEVAANIMNLRISELHYNPLDPSASELLVVPDADNNDFEFVELINISEQPVSLNNVRFTDGVTFDFTSGVIPTLDPGETVLVVKNSEAFVARYGEGLPVAGEYKGKLSGSSEDVVLVDRSDNTIHDFKYYDSTPWPEAADGDGPSLEVIDLLSSLNDPANWQASVLDNGTPGMASPPLLGDYDRSGVVDQLDHTTWVSQFGDTVAMPGAGADGNFDGVINAADYTVWRDRLGQAAPPTQSFSFIQSRTKLTNAPVNHEDADSFVMFPPTEGRSKLIERPALQKTSQRENNRQGWIDLAMLIVTDGNILANYNGVTIDTDANTQAITEEEMDTAFLEWEIERALTSGIAGAN